MTGRAFWHTDLIPSSNVIATPVRVSGFNSVPRLSTGISFAASTSSSMYKYSGRLDITLPLSSTL
jgi:hypothetical protein